MLKVQSSYLDYPYVVGIETLRLCNASCGFCPYTNLPNKGSELPTETVYGLIRALRQIPHRFRVNFSRVNEPLLDKRISNFYSYAAETLPNASFILFSNGSLLDAGHLQWVIKTPRLIVNVSLNEYEPEPYNQLMGLDFSKTWNNLRMLHADWPADGCCYVSRVGDGSFKDAEFVRRVKLEFPKFLVSVSKRFAWLSDRAVTPPPDAACMQYYSLHVLSTGRVACCCIDGDGRYGRYEVGDILTRGISKIYQSSLLAQGRANFLPRRKMPAPCSCCDNWGQTKLTLP